MPRLPIAGLVIALAALGGLSPAHADTFPRYQVIDLGPGTAASSRPGLGVVGEDHRHRAIRWADGRKRVLPPGSEWSWATHLNAQGVMAGGFLDAQDREHPVRWSADGTLLDLYQAGDPGGAVSGLDDAGRVTGYWYRDGGVQDGFVVDADGQRHPFPFLGAGDWSIPSGTSPSGWIVAEVNDTPGGAHRCARYAGGTFEVLALPAHATSCAPAAINDAGDVAAIVGTPYGPKAVVWHGGQWTELDPTGGYISPFAINSQGVVVGERGTHRRGKGTAFVWAAGVIRKLDTLLDASATGWRIERANGIDDAGQIAAIGRGPGQRGDHALLLVPVPR